MSFLIGIQKFLDRNKAYVIYRRRGVYKCHGQRLKYNKITKVSQKNLKWLKNVYGVEEVKNG